jgi:hypothetical protein
MVVTMRKEAIMIRKKVLQPKRLRRIDGGFSFIPHRFVTDGFLSALNQKELLLYFFLVVVSDRSGLSFYSYDVICSLLEICVDQYITARDGLIQKDLIAFDGTLFQVLDLPRRTLRPTAQSDREDQVASLVQQSLGEKKW